MSGRMFIGLMRQQANIFAGAVAFLTRVPTGRFYECRPEELARSAVYFPFVGMLIGLGAGVVLLGANAVFPPFVAVLFCMAASVCSTGGLHEDGLADAADGLIAGHDAQQRLEIMRDSRLGTYGALALWFSLTAKLFLLHALLAQGLWLAIGALVVAHACGRMSSVALLHYCPYARAEESKSKPFGNSVTMVEVSIALTLTVAFSFLVIGDKAALCLLGATLMTGAVSGFVKKRIGGVTGDCLGAANQLVELTCYAVLIAQLRVGES